MTKEDLKNKCKERAKIFQQAMESCKSSNPMDCIEWFADRIAELENRQLEKEKCELLGIIQGKDKVISVLKKENAELKKNLKEKLKTIADKDLSFVAKFDALEIENAEMRELLKTLNESIVMTADDTFWSLRDDVEKFLEEC